jgi:hypothetical protein
MKLGLIKFKYGEEIIAEYELQGSSVLVKNAAYMMPIENNQWHLMTWLPYTNVRDGITIDKNDIFFIADLSADMVEYYNKWREALKKNIRIDLDK